MRVHILIVLLVILAAFAPLKDTSTAVQRCGSIFNIWDNIILPWIQDSVDWWQTPPPPDGDSGWVDGGPPGC